MKRENKAKLDKQDVEWVVNDAAELGVKIGTQFFWLYKGESLVYTNDPDAPKKYRRVGRVEFGVCCHPVDMVDRSKMNDYDEYTAGEEWEELTPFLFPDGESNEKEEDPLPVCCQKCEHLDKKEGACTLDPNDGRDGPCQEYVKEIAAAGKVSVPKNFTDNHLIMTPNGWTKVKDLFVDKKSISEVVENLCTVTNRLKSYLPSGSEQIAKVTGHDLLEDVLELKRLSDKLKATNPSTSSEEVVERCLDCKKRDEVFQDLYVKYSELITENQRKEEYQCNQCSCGPCGRENWEACIEELTAAKTHWIREYRTLEKASNIVVKQRDDAVQELDVHRALNEAPRNQVEKVKDERNKSVSRVQELDRILAVATEERDKARMAAAVLRCEQRGAADSHETDELLDRVSKIERVVNEVITQMKWKLVEDDTKVTMHRVRYTQRSIKRWINMLQPLLSAEAKITDEQHSDKKCNCCGEKEANDSWYLCNKCYDADSDRIRTLRDTVKKADTNQREQLNDKLLAIRSLSNRVETERERADKAEKAAVDFEKDANKYQGRLEALDARSEHVTRKLNDTVASMKRNIQEVVSIIRKLIDNDPTVISATIVRDELQLWVDLLLDPVVDFDSSKREETHLLSTSEKEKQRNLVNQMETSIKNANSLMASPDSPNTEGAVCWNTTTLEFVLDWIKSTQKEINNGVL